MAEHEYTPTTKKVRLGYAVSAVWPSATDPKRAAEFDRWMAAHDAEVREEADAEIRTFREQYIPRLNAAEAELSEVREHARHEFCDPTLGCVVAEEPEWEYGIRAEGDDEPYTDHSDDPDWLCDQVSPEPGDAIVRRQKAGPWAPKQEGSET